MKKNIILALLTLIGLVACDSSGTIKLTNPGENLETHSTHQTEFLKDQNPSNIGKYAAYASLENYANPAPITLKWNKSGNNIKVQIAEKEDFSDAISYQVSGKKFDFYNAKIDTNYFWKVSSFDKNNDLISESEIGTFSTSKTCLRNIFVEGVDNFRDLGCYKTESGKTIKQGLIYRSGEINKNKETNLTVLATENGLWTLNNELKIKTDIDLRKNVESDGTIETGGITKSPISSNVQYISAPMYYDGENILEHSDKEKAEVNIASVKLFFNTIADENNYPVVFHCVQGKDRTGCLAYLLNALLGVSDTDLARDYLFTNFSTSVGSACAMKDIERRYLVTLSREEGNSLSEKTYNYLNKTLGISSDNLDKIISNLTY